MMRMIAFLLLVILSNGCSSRLFPNGLDAKQVDMSIKFSSVVDAQGHKVPFHEVCVPLTEAEKEEIIPLIEKIKTSPPSLNPFNFKWITPLTPLFYLEVYFPERTYPVTLRFSGEGRLLGEIEYDDLWSWQQIRLGYFMLNAAERAIR